MCLLQLQLLLTPRESIFSSISLSLTAGGAISWSLEESQTMARLRLLSSDTATRYNAMSEGGALKPDQGLIYFRLAYN